MSAACKMIEAPSELTDADRACRQYNQNRPAAATVTAAARAVARALARA
jgi:hypothetical protein